MKLITKYFVYDGKSSFAVDRLVALSLKKQYDFDLCMNTAYLDDKINQRAVLQCATPDALYRAMSEGKTMTFSVTLPAKYWK